MKKNIYIISIILSFSQISYSQSYPLVTIEDIQYLPDSVLINSGDQQSPLNGDTVRVQGVVMIRPVVDAQTDRRPILRAADFWMIYIVDPDGQQYEFFDGINPIQVDTMGVNQNTLFDLVDTADVVEFTVVIDEFFTTTQAVLLLNPVTPVSIVGNLGTRPSPIEVDISEFVDAQGNWDPLSEKYEGQYVIVRNAISSDRDLNSGTFRINDGQGNSILMYDQSGYFTLRAHRLTGITDYEPPVDNADINYIRGFIQTHSELGIRIAPAYPGDISVSGIFGDSIGVLIPNGGEEWEAGTTQQINWFSSSVDQIRIEYSTDSGVNWQTIIEQLPNNNFYDWVIPNTASVNCKVRISNQFNPFVSDISDNVFIILPSTIPIINILTPNGGEVWVMDDTKDITWTSENVDDVKIELSIDNGANWSAIVDSIPSIGTYSWIVNASAPSTECLIRISDVADSTAYDESDSVFTIMPTPSLIVVSPNGGEVWMVGSTQQINWFSISVNTVKIEYSTDSGVNWQTVIEQLPNNNFYDWIIPNTVSVDCKVRISNQFNPSVSDISDNVFIILPPPDPIINIISPNGGENWAAGSTQSIMWNDNISENVKIELYKAGVFYSTIIASTPSDGFKDWDIPFTQETGLDYKVKITSVNDSSIFVFSDADFTIIGFELTIISPNGGENWQIGSNQTIRWTDNLPGNVRIFLYKGGSLHSVITNSTSNDSVFSWDIPLNLESGSDYRVNISSEINGDIFDFSDEDFALSTVSITVTSPDGGEVWPLGSTQDITWLSVNVIDVKIELSLNNGASWSTIIDSTLSIGIYSWLINPPQPSNQALIRISDVSDENIVDQSDDVFTIDIAPSVDEEFSGIPDSYKLLQNYPNPFNPSTTIYYGLPEESSVRITIYDVLGNELKLYSEDKQEAGYHRVEFDATALPSGIYFYRLQAGSFVETKKMILLK